MLNFGPIRRMIVRNERTEEDHEISDSEQPELDARKLRKRNS